MLRLLLLENGIEGGKFAPSRPMILNTRISHFYNLSHDALTLYIIIGTFKPRAKFEDKNMENVISSPQ